MLKYVLRRTGRNPAYPGRWRMTRVLGARHARIPGMPWLRCLTNRWWSPRFQQQRYVLSEATTGFTASGFTNDSRRMAIGEATQRLQRLSKARILAAIARVQAGHTNRHHIPQHFRARTL